jgi:hypothetical protein
MYPIFPVCFPACHLDVISLDEVQTHPSESFEDIRHVVAIRRRNAEGDAKVGKRFVRIMTAMHLADRLRIDIASFGADQHAFLKVGLERALQRQKERRATMAMKIRPPFGAISAV